MSNLNLPKLTYSHLSEVLGHRDQKQLAYATDVVRYGDELRIKHHGTTIAILTADQVRIGGVYDSRTTADRCHRILRDNAPHTDFNIGITKGELCLRRGREARPFSRVVIDSASGIVTGSVYIGNELVTVTD